MAPAATPTFPADAIPAPPFVLEVVTADADELLAEEPKVVAALLSPVDCVDGIIVCVTTCAELPATVEVTITLDAVLVFAFVLVDFETAANVPVAFVLPLEVALEAELVYSVGREGSPLISQPLEVKLGHARAVTLAAAESGVPVGDRVAHFVDRALKPFLDMGVGVPVVAPEG